MDRTIMLGFAKGRTPWLTMVAVDLTALGSVTHSVVCAASLERSDGGLQLVPASVGAALLTTTINDYIEPLTLRSLHSPSRFRACPIQAATHSRPHPSI